MSQEGFELAGALSHEIGPVVVVTGTPPPPSLAPGVTVLAAPKYDNSSYRARAAAWLRYVGHVLPCTLRIHGKPVVLVTTNPPLLPFVAYSLRRARGWPYVVWIWDLYPDALTNHGLIRRGNPIARVWSRANRLAFGAASTVLTLSRGMQQSARRYLPGGAEPGVVPTWVDVEEIAPVARRDNPFAVEHGMGDELVVVYSGNLGLTHEFSGVVEAIGLLENESRVRFLFIGGGARRDELEALALRYPSVTVLPLQPRSEIRYSLAAGDVALVTIGAGIGSVSMPSKTYSYMAAGCALLGLSEADTDLAQMIRGSGVGRNVSALDGPAIAAAIRGFLDDPAFLGRCRVNARELAKREFSAERCMDELVAIVRAAGAGALV